MKKTLAIAMALIMLVAICAVPAMADDAKNSPELGETVIIPIADEVKVSADDAGTEEDVEFTYNKPESHPYVYVLPTENGYAIVWAASDDISIEDGKAKLPDNSYVTIVSSIDEVEEIVYGKPTSIAVDVKSSIDAKSILIDPSTIDDYYIKNIYSEKATTPTPDGKPVTSPDTSDVFACLLGTLALVDGGAVCYYLKKKKEK